MPVCDYVIVSCSHCLCAEIADLQDHKDLIHLGMIECKRCGNILK